ncbi:flagellar motor protein MotA [Rhizobiaceae bacterium BDR2-2]|uniref:Flagellar motor protein MotA n=1 Tax=Ectorhizobium quercum TaxID=2965071 RepID=A0AAE3SU32_9HYPH|nr:flagellar motor protein MotA [Ectorhizobium quercum]MCX8996800.1 flagellar motor protein MotA [Ectorhizobium quercum]
MADISVDETDGFETGRFAGAAKLSSPMPIFWTMVLFLIIVGFITAILYRQAHTAFMTNPGLNGLILGVLLIGAILVFTHVFGLRREAQWFNSFQAAGQDADRVGGEPKLLAPMRSLIGRRHAQALSTAASRSILDSIATRLDESRDTSRYLIGLLVFLGLLGTFWGLIGTIGSIGSVIQSLDTGGDSNDVLSAVKNGLGQPLAGMGTAFSSSLLGLSGSLILGFLDLQAGRAQNRFYMEVENWLSSVTDVGSDAGNGSQVAGSEDLRRLTEELAKLAKAGGAEERSVAAMAHLAEGVQGLVRNMRNEQQMLRDWIEKQQQESQELRRVIDILAARKSGGNG